MKDGIINLDTDFAKELGFTSDKFYGYLWISKNTIWISFIESKQQGKGHFKALLDTIKEKGYDIIVPTPFPRMEAICLKWGMDKHRLLNENHDTMIEEAMIYKNYKPKNLFKDLEQTEFFKPEKP